jgi:fructose-1,6-bisphosphatase/inositol monophosphatase family enzyme
VRASALDHRDLDVLHRVADEIGPLLSATTDWGLSGLREGQYAVDVAVDEIAVSILLDGGFAVLSEESGRSGDGERLAVIDPLDGSTNASLGIPWFATSLCVVDGEGPAVALVANQASGQRLEAVRRQGAWLDDRRLASSGRTTLDGAVVGLAGMPPGGPWGWWQFRALGAAALDLGLVAGGGLDGWVDLSTAGHGPWDYLAGALLCTEAGCAVADRRGHDLLALEHGERRAPVAAATPELLEALLAHDRSS